MENTDKKSLKVVYGDFTLGVHGEGFDYIFSYGRGGLESLVKDGREWLYRCPMPTFWRALTDNDRGSKFYLKSGMWFAADQFIECKQIEVTVDGISQGKPKAPYNNQYQSNVFANEVVVRFVYRTITVPSTNVTVIYTVKESGNILVNVHYEGAAGLPELPVFGLRFIMPTLADQYIYEGLSGETYPDRKAGAEKDVYEIEDLSLTPYIVPQDCGVRMDTAWVDVVRETSLRFGQTDQPFAFSCLPYTALEIENATHHEELPHARRTVFCIYGAVRGVGGIDSWGSDVEESCRISGEQDIDFSFVIS